MGTAAQLSTDSQGRVLVVVDNYPLRRLLHSTFLDAGFDVAEAASGEEAIALVRLLRHDAVLIDLCASRTGGIETCQALRHRFPSLAILMSTLDDSEDEKILAFDSGADALISKPFRMRELTAHLHAAVRRAKTIRQPESEATLRLGEIEIDSVRRFVSKSGTPVHLTPKEFDVLHYLMSNVGVPVSHRQLLTAVWGAERAENIEYLRTFIRQLRSKLEDVTGSPKYIMTVSHFGYRFGRNDHHAGRYSTA
jgi:two-component system KDP operon response regulator KdpE